MTREHHIEAVPLTFDNWAVYCHRTTASRQSRHYEVWVDERMVVALSKECAITPVEIALSRQLFGKQNVMLIEFDMPIGGLCYIMADDRRPIDELPEIETV